MTIGQAENRTMSLVNVCWTPASILHDCACLFHRIQPCIPSGLGFPRRVSVWYSKASWRGWDKDASKPKMHRRAAAYAMPRRCCCRRALAVALLWRMAVEIHPFLSRPAACALQQRASGWPGLPSAYLRGENHGLSCNGRVTCPSRIFKLLTPYKISFPCHDFKIMEGSDLDPNTAKVRESYYFYINLLMLLFLFF